MRFKKLLFTGGIFLAVLCMALSAVSAASAYPKGDANMDGQVNIRDATAVQKYAADIITLSSEACTYADADQNGKVTVKDATCIQKMIVNITLPETTASTGNADISNTENNSNSGNSGSSGNSGNSGNNGGGGGVVLPDDEW